MFVEVRFLIHSLWVKPSRATRCTNAEDLLSNYVEYRLAAYSWIKMNDARRWRVEGRDQFSPLLECREMSDLTPKSRALKAIIWCHTLWCRYGFFHSILYTIPQRATRCVFRHICNAVHCTSELRRPLSVSKFNYHKTSAGHLSLWQTCLNCSVFHVSWENIQQTCCRPSRKYQTFQVPILHVIIQSKDPRLLIFIISWPQFNNISYSYLIVYITVVLLVFENC
jgi:hypothetical protein